MFCIQGNHEQRPFNIETYEEIEMFGAKVYIEKEFNNLILAKDGEIYSFDGFQTIVIGGAYNIDKLYRIVHNLPWFKDEQPSDKSKKYVEKQLKKKKWKIDLVISHTCSFDYRPIKVNAVDTVGAGDTFAGVLAARLSEGNISLEEAVKIANKAAALKVSRLGGQAAIPTREEIDKI